MALTIRMISCFGGFDFTLRRIRPTLTSVSTVMPPRQVDSLAPGGPAECSKMVEPGDRLITINGKSIRGLDARSV